MNECTDENNQPSVSACGTSDVQPTWEAKQIADGIDRMIEEGGKGSPGAPVFEEPDRLPV